MFKSNSANIWQFFLKNFLNRTYGIQKYEKWRTSDRTKKCVVDWSWLDRNWTWFPVFYHLKPGKATELTRSWPVSERVDQSVTTTETVLIKSLTFHCFFQSNLVNTLTLRSAAVRGLTNFIPVRLGSTFLNQNWQDCNKINWKHHQHHHSQL